MVRGASEQLSDLLRDFPRKFLPDRAYMIEDRPFAFTRHSSLRDGPFGRFSPRSHWLTRLGGIFRYRAKTAWLARSRFRRLTITDGVIS
jgi:hypothetical protein